MKSGDYFEKEYEFLPWNALTGSEKDRQAKWQKELSDQYKVTFGEESVVSTEAFLYEVEGSFGNKTQIGSYALLRRLEIATGDNCSFNSFAVVHGKVSMGSNVRIAPGAKIFGENHNFQNLDLPICQQGNSRKGIIIKDDVWIGANAVICDGVTIGQGVVVGAGSVVTRDVPDFCVVGGSPARVIRNRLAEKKNTPAFEEKIKAFDKWARENIQGIIASHFEEGDYVNSNSNKEKRRALCDAVEIAGAFDIELPMLTKEAAISKIRSFQKDENEYECVMSSSYALEILGEKPIEFTFCNTDTWGYLSSLAWKSDAWNAGHYTDIFATALYMNKKHYKRQFPESMFAWLGLNQSADGLWGEGDIHLRVNGYYRTTRGTYDQFKLKPGYIKEGLDTILDYASKKGVPLNACDALDIIHPLYFLGGFSPYRKTEGEAWCVKMLGEFMNMKTPYGFPFEKGGEPSLKGTEMWFSIIYLMCDYLGKKSLLSYEPKGVHRTK